MTKTNQRHANTICAQQKPLVVRGLHPAWVAFIKHCRDLGFGEISQLKIQDGVPVMAEEITKKVKFV